MLMSQVVLSRRSKVPIPAGDRRQKVGSRPMCLLFFTPPPESRAFLVVRCEMQAACRRDVVGFQIS